MLGLARIHVWIATAFLLLGGQEGAKSEKTTAEEQLRALIEKTNELKSFVADYELESPQHEVIQLHLAYAAPDRICLHWGSGEESMTWLFSEGLMTFHSRDPKQGERYMRARTYPLSAEVVSSYLDGAREQFPKARIEDPTESLRAFIKIYASHDSGEPRIEFEVMGISNPPAVLGWLSFLRDKTRLISEDAKHLEFEGEDDARFVLQKSTGFLQGVRLPFEGGLKELRLKTLELDVAVDDEEFHAPELDPKAKDDSANAQGAALWAEVMQLKFAVAVGVGQLVKEQEFAWNDEARSHFQTALYPLHAEVLKLQTGEWIEQAAPSIEAFCFWFQTMRSRAGEDEKRLSELDDTAERREQSLREQIAPMRKCFQELHAAKESELWTEFIELDRAAFDAAFAEHVEKPTLGRLAEKLQLAREGKLTDPNEGKLPEPPDCDTSSDPGYGANSYTR